MNPSMKLLRGLLPALLVVSASACSSGSLQPPQGYYLAVQQNDNKPKSCPTPPTPFTGKMFFPSKYEGSDSARSKLNVGARDRYQQLTRDITDMERGVSNTIERYMKHGHPQELECSLEWLSTWAEADALLSKDFNHTGKSMRKWALATFASSYLRLKYSSSQPLIGHEQQAEKIERWLAKVAEQVVSDWDGLPLKNTNNHSYWAAWSVMASAVVSDRRDLFDWAVGKFRQAAHQVNDQGLLPNELKRRERALAYHNYSLGPLTMLAVFAQANGVDLRQENDAALQRLAQNVLDGLADHEHFARLAHAEQETDDLQGDSKFAWLEPYCALYSCSDKTLSWKTSMEPLRTFRLGGDVSALFNDLETQRRN
jgi:poly(beta-D-mannuronate) lyase